MKTRHRNLFLILALACAFSIFTFTAPVQAQCLPTGDATGVGIALIAQPFATAPGIPAPDPNDEIVRREHAYISTALAGQLGIAPHDPNGTITLAADWRDPNPQIRVWIDQPATFQNFWRRSSGVNQFRNRRSSAVFTVVGVVQNNASRIWVYEQQNNTDRDSGEYKLFASDNATTTGGRVVEVDTFTDGDADGDLDNVTAQVFTDVTSTRTITRNGQTTTDPDGYCEPDANGALVETGVNRYDNDIVLLVPHGGDIEAGTSEQITPFLGVLEAAPFNQSVSWWDVQGTWGDNQTPKRWHITATDTHESSWPALETVLDQTQFDPAADRTFRYAVSFHGFTANTATALEVIVGGDAAQGDKCLVVQRIQDRLATAGFSRQEIAFVIHDAAGVIDVPNKNGQNVGRRDLAGLSDDNIVNRWAADGGVQLEQSRAVRDSVDLRNAVARGAAQALGELIAGTAPADPCDPYVP